LNGELRNSSRASTSVDAVGPRPVGGSGRQEACVQGDLDAADGVVAIPPSDGVTAKPTRSGWGIKVVREISLALAIYGMAGWIYVGLCALVAPATLALPLTHLMPWLREDTSGVLSFIVSFLGFISYRISRRT
jgi:hypothetical protein